MLIQEAIFPDIEEVKEPKQAEIFEKVGEENEGSATITDEVVKPRNKGGRPRKK